ncbi:MAG: esterase/lipase family protein [Nitrospinota bacterium]
MTLLVLLFLGGVLVFNLMMYAVRLYDRGGRPGWERRFYHLSWAVLRDFLVESLCVLLLLALWLADFVGSVVWKWLGREPGPWTVSRSGDRPPGDRPVILCHGFHMRGLTLGVLAFWLRRLGRSVVVLPTFGPATADIRHYADQLAGHIRDALDRSGANAVDLVGHSMGGLIARACLAQARRSGGPDLRVARLVTLGTPHRGTGFWVFTWGDCGLDMRPGSPFLSWLGDEPAGVDATAIASPFDGLVYEESALGWNAPGVRKIKVEGVGHVALSMLPRVARRVFEALGG